MNITKTGLLKKRSDLFKKLESHKDFLKGTLNQVRRRGQIANAYHLTYKDKNQKTCTKYVSAKNLKKVEKGIKKMGYVKRILDEIAELNLDLIEKT